MNRFAQFPCLLITSSEYMSANWLVSPWPSWLYWGVGHLNCHPSSRKWRNWQTRRPQEPVRLSLMGVQVPPSAPPLKPVTTGINQHFRREFVGPAIGLRIGRCATNVRQIPRPMPAVGRVEGRLVIVGHALHGPESRHTPWALRCHVPRLENTAM